MLAARLLCLDEIGEDLGKRTLRFESDRDSNHWSSGHLESSIVPRDNELSSVIRIRVFNYRNPGLLIREHAISTLHARITRFVCPPLLSILSKHMSYKYLAQLSILRPAHNRSANLPNFDWLP